MVVPIVCYGSTPSILWWYQLVIVVPMQQRMLTSDLADSNQLPDQLQPINRIKSYCTCSIGFMQMFVMVVSDSIPSMLL